MAVAHTDEPLRLDPAVHAFIVMPLPGQAVERGQHACRELMDCGHPLLLVKHCPMRLSARGLKRSEQNPVLDARRFRDIAYKQVFVADDSAVG